MRSPFALTSMFLGRALLLGVLAIGTMLSVDAAGTWLEQYALQRPEARWLTHFQRDPSIVVLGSSTILYGLDDTTLSQSAGLGDSEVVTLGSLGATSMDTYYTWLSAQKYIRPKIALISFDPWLYTEKPFLTSEYYFTLYSPLERLQLFIAPPHTMRRSRIFSGDPVLATLANILKRSDALDTAPSTAFGASDENTLVPTSIDPRLFFGTTSHVAYYEPFFIRMKQLLDTLRMEHIVPILVLTPKRRNWLEGYEHGCGVQDSLFVALFNRYVGPVHTIGSFHIPVGLDERAYMRDDVHLAYAGREEFSRRVGLELSSALASQPHPLRHLWDY